MFEFDSPRSLMSRAKDPNRTETAYCTTLSKLILEKRYSVIEKDNFMVIIRPTDESVYKNTVDVLDEMEITNQLIYAIIDISPKEVEVYQNKLKL